MTVLTEEVLVCVIFSIILSQCHVSEFNSMFRIHKWRLRDLFLLLNSICLIQRLIYHLQPWNRGPLKHQTQKIGHGLLAKRTCCQLSPCLFKYLALKEAIIPLYFFEFSIDIFILGKEVFFFFSFFNMDTGKENSPIKILSKKFVLSAWFTKYVQFQFTAKVTKI